MYVVLHPDLVSDAMGIYSTYIALNALTSVHVPDDIRQSVEGIGFFGVFSHLFCVVRLFNSKCLEKLSLQYLGTC